MSTEKAKTQPVGQGNGLVFADYSPAEIVHVENRLHTVFVFEGKTYPSRKSVVRAARSAREKEKARGDYSAESWRRQALLSSSSAYTVSKELVDAYQVLMNGEVILEVPTLHAAEQEVRTEENRQRRMINNLLESFGTDRHSVNTEVPELAEMIALYSADDMYSARDTFMDRYADAKAGAAFPKTLEEERGIYRHARREFIQELWSKIVLVGDELGKENDRVLAHMDMVLAMVDYDKIFAQVH